MARKNFKPIRDANDTTLMAESEEKLNSFLMKLKEDSEKADLKLNIQKMKIMASSPNTSWQIDGETMGTVTDFIFLGFKITADVTTAMILKTIAPWKKSYDQPRQHIKIRDITLPIKVSLVKAMVFPVVVYGCEG